jgi:hypothetical protein
MIVSLGPFGRFGDARFVFPHGSCPHGSGFIQIAIRRFIQMMKMQEVRELARRLGVKTGGVSKAVAIRRIQEAEGNFPCFGTATGGVCDRHDCAFREDCLGTEAPDAGKA